MPALKFPATIFQTKHKFNDYSTDDMKCGDFTEKQLRSDLGLADVSNVVDPGLERKYQYLTPSRIPVKNPERKWLNFFSMSFFVFLFLHITLGNIKYSTIS